jgi:hypothetical protein
MPPAEFYVRLQRGTPSIRLSWSPAPLTACAGITGGFAPPTPSAVHALSRASGQTLLSITSETRKDGEPSLSAAAPKSLDASDAHTAKLVDELEGILRTIPTESPPGSEDIYGLDTSIMWGSDGLEWMNGGPAGCGGGKSEVQATPEDKKKFERAVQIVQTLVESSQ